jgi:mannonate dehydratase
MDNGYYDMSKIMEALVEVKFDGIVILDHTPLVIGGHYAEQAYGFAYMKALKDRAEAKS